MDKNITYNKIVFNNVKNNPIMQRETMKEFDDVMDEIIEQFTNFTTTAFAYGFKRFHVKLTNEPDNDDGWGRITELNRKYNYNFWPHVTSRLMDIYEKINYSVIAYCRYSECMDFWHVFVAVHKPGASRFKKFLDRIR